MANVITVRVTSEQHRNIKAAAMRAGVSMEAFCRDSFARAIATQNLLQTIKKSQSVNVWGDIYFDEDLQQYAVRFADSSTPTPTTIYHANKSVLEDLIDWVDAQRGNANGKSR